ncbi:MAG: 4Fe-4S binding protein [Anaerolineales bacterium]|nr:4Fe-4S binding protein [Anaerolineales bacterium]
MMTRDDMSDITELTSYQKLAKRLDSLPSGFPATPDGTELRLLAKLYSPEEAELASQLRLTLETPEQIAARIGGDAALLRKQLKEMSIRGLISAGKTRGGLGFGLMPFVVGIYEMQFASIDTELAELFESYYNQGFRKLLEVQPPVHRVIPINESIPIGLEVHPFESAAEIIASNKSWGVLDCICRKQKMLIGQPCQHPLDVCMAMSTVPGAFDHSTTIRALTQEEALQVLHRAAEAGLVHSVSNNQDGLWYICNCCTCSCGILRGMSELGLAGVVARSAFVNTVDSELCVLCGDCIERCQFNALRMEEALNIDTQRCAGCGVCVLACQEGALQLVLRPETEITPPPVREMDWMKARARSRELDLDEVL